MRHASSLLSHPESSSTQSFFAAKVFIVRSASGKAEDAGQAALQSLSPADGLCIVEVMAAARRTRAITSETLRGPRASWSCMAAAESLVFGGARGPATAPKESKALQELKELKDPTMLEEPKVLENPQERKELKEPNVLKDPMAHGASSIVVCNYFVLGVK